MSRSSSLDLSKSYTFRSYFDLGISPRDLAIAFDFSLLRSPLVLPQYTSDIPRLPSLRQQIDEVLPHVDLANEATRREVLIAPIIAEVVRIAHAELSIEYSIQVSAQLQGTLDYLLQTDLNLLVIEAKQADLTRGFSQLAAELIALDRWVDSNSPTLVGAVTTGDIWQFGLLRRSEKQIVQGLNRYRVPEDLESVLRSLLGCLTQDSAFGLNVVA
jgi:hypothetical protein